MRRRNPWAEFLLSVLVVLGFFVVLSPGDPWKGDGLMVMCGVCVGIGFQRFLDDFWGGES